MPSIRPALAQSMPVYTAQMCVATDGANMGDVLSFADELMLDDFYKIKSNATPERLSILARETSHFTIASDTGIGTSGADLHLDCALTFMSQKGEMHDALLMVEVDESGGAVQIYLMPLNPLVPDVEYRLVGIDTQNARQKFAQMACVSFTRGTRITLASGEQRPIQDLKLGDRILTRDDGVQQIRWIGQDTVRATGDFAPICIRAGTLNNENDLILSPDHRLFIYQREDALGAGRSELLIKARHLVNGDTVIQQSGGFVDYFQLLFDSHQIIYAEGIAAESMLIDQRTKPILPRDLSAAMGEVIPGHSDLPHAGLDVSEALLNRVNAAEVLRKASTR